MGSGDQNTTETDWVDRWGQPMADYEVRAIESDDWVWRDEEVAAHLGFDLLPMRLGNPAAACDTCGAMFVCTRRHWRAHRRLCGWDNGAPAVNTRGEA